jgi:outer membrane protein assembly factor BamA
VIGTNGTVVASTQRVTSLGSSIIFTTFTQPSDVYFTGQIKCNVGGVLTLQFAEGTAHTAGTATLNAGSFVELNDCVAV